MIELDLQRRPRSEIRITRMVLTLLWMFTILNLPSHVFRMCVMFESLSNPQSSISNRTYVWQQCLLYLFFSRFIVNFPVLFVSSPVFRKHVQSAFVWNRQRPVYRPRCGKTSVCLTENGNVQHTQEDVTTL